MRLTFRQWFALQDIRATFEVLSERDVWWSDVFACVRHQQTVGPMALELLIHCRDMSWRKAIKRNTYNDEEVMFSVLVQSLEAWRTRRNVGRK